PFADFEIAFRADMNAAVSERRVERLVPMLEMQPRLFARGHDAVIEPLRNADPGDAAHHVIRAARRVRQQHEPFPCCDQPLHTVEHTGERRRPVMHDPPQIEDEAVILRRQLSHAVDNANAHDAPLVPIDTCATLAWSVPTASATEAKPSRRSRAVRPVLMSPIRAGPAKTSAV